MDEYLRSFALVPENEATQEEILRLARVTARWEDALKVQGQLFALAEDLRPSWPVARNAAYLVEHEVKDLVRAFRAYLNAFRLAPDDAEITGHLWRLAALIGRRAAGARRRGGSTAVKERWRRSRPTTPTSSSPRASDAGVGGAPDDRGRRRRQRCRDEGRRRRGGVDDAASAGEQLGQGEATASRRRGRRSRRGRGRGDPPSRRGRDRRRGDPRRDRGPARGAAGAACASPPCPAPAGAARRGFAALVRDAVGRAGAGLRIAAGRRLRRPGTPTC